MKAVKSTAIEVVALLAIAIALGFGVNAVRGKDSINFSRNYFEIRVPVVSPAPQTAQTADPPEAPQGGKTADHGEFGEPQPQQAVADHSGISSDAGAQPEPEDQLEHPFNRIAFREVAEIFYEPETRTGLNIFMDARNKRDFAEGHIPGAYQCDHYCIEEYVDEIPEALQGAERIIVYCAGGQCEDSVLLCGDLIDLGIPYDKLCVFGGGWAVWQENDMPVEKGAD